MPKNGSLKTMASTRLPTTVEGTVALYQSAGLNSSEEILLPDAWTLAEDSMVQPSARSVLSADPATAAPPPRPKLVTRITKHADRRLHWPGLARYGTTGLEILAFLEFQQRETPGLRCHGTPPFDVDLSTDGQWIIIAKHGRVNPTDDRREAETAVMGFFEVWRLGDQSGRRRGAGGWSGPGANPAILQR